MAPEENNGNGADGYVALAGASEKPANRPEVAQEPKADDGPFSKLGLVQKHFEEFLAGVIEKHFSKDLAEFISNKIEGEAVKPKFDPYTGKPVGG